LCENRAKEKRQIRALIVVFRTLLNNSPELY